MTFNPETEISQSFWDLIATAERDVDKLHDTLMKLERDEIVAHCAAYKDAQTELVDQISSRISDASEDVLDDLADALVATGKEEYTRVYLGHVELPSRTEWSGLNGLIHVFDSVFYNRFEEDIWDEID